MTIATLILTCTIFVALGRVGNDYAPIALGVGAVVCIAAAIAGATSQDLKTGYIVGATPSSQQIGLMVGVVVVGLRHRPHDPLPAQRDDDRIGVAAGAAGDADVHHHPRAAGPEPAVGPGAGGRVHLGHARALRCAVAVVRGRLLPADRHDRADLRRRRRALVGRAAHGSRTRRASGAFESEISSGTLFSSGLIAGGSLAGILYAGLFGRNLLEAADDGATTGLIPFLHEGPVGNAGRRPALPGAGRHRGPGRDAQSGISR